MDAPGKPHADIDRQAYEAWQEQQATFEGDQLRAVQAGTRHYIENLSAAAETMLDSSLSDIERGMAESYLKTVAPHIEPEKVQDWALDLRCAEGTLREVSDYWNGDMTVLNRARTQVEMVAGGQYEQVRDPDLLREMPLPKGEEVVAARQAVLEGAVTMDGAERGAMKEILAGIQAEPGSEEFRKAQSMTQFYVPGGDFSKHWEEVALQHFTQDLPETPLGEFVDPHGGLREIQHIEPMQPGKERYIDQVLEASHALDAATKSGDINAIVDATTELESLAPAGLAPDQIDTWREAVKEAAFDETLQRLDIEFYNSYGFDAPMDGLNEAQSRLQDLIDGKNLGQHLGTAAEATADVSEFRQEQMQAGEEGVRRYIDQVRDASQEYVSTGSDAAMDRLAELAPREMTAAELDDWAKDIQKADAVLQEAHARTLDTQTATLWPGTVELAEEQFDQVVTDLRGQHEQVYDADFLSRVPPLSAEERREINGALVGEAVVLDAQEREAASEVFAGLDAEPGSPEFETARETLSEFMPTGSDLSDEAWQEAARVYAADVLDREPLETYFSAEGVALDEPAIEASVGESAAEVDHDNDYGLELDQDD
ncbi:hypothetical protein ABH944_008561 [Caballeronia udeis]|uniref:Uncharacterized protein n=1 Tax=Caballeronia udeis TaxID=1232866 RepID=A0ABW8N0D6_9BURK